MASACKKRRTKGHDLQNDTAQDKDVGIAAVRKHSNTQRPSQRYSERPTMDFLPFRGVENDTSAYLPLGSQAKEIRYIVLEPGAKHSPITCTLGYTSLR